MQHLINRRQIIVLRSNKHPQKKIDVTLLFLQINSPEKNVTSGPAVQAGSSWLRALAFSSTLQMGSENPVFIFKSSIHICSANSVNILHFSFSAVVVLWHKKKDKVRKEKHPHTKCNCSNKTTRSYFVDKFARDKTTIPKSKHYTKKKNK